MNEQEFKLIKRIAFRLYKKRNLGRLYEADDLYSTGWQAVEEAHEKLGDNVPESLLAQVIRRRMIDYIRVLRKRMQDPISDAHMLSDVAFYDGEDYDVSITDSSAIEKTLSREAFEHIIRVLLPSERNMVRLYIEAELKYREIGEIMGVHESYVCQIFKGRIFPLIAEAIK